jgi:ABC-type branched-subunit amino acid transport system ATPase component
METSGLSGTRSRRSASKATAGRGASLAVLERLVEVDGLEFSYGRVQVLFGVTFHVERNEILAVLGTNGAGKSTVLRLVAGLAVPERGTVRFDGRDVTGMPAERLCRLGISLVMGGRGVFPDLSVRENFELGGFTLGRELQGRIERELERFPQLARRVRSLGGSLSGGEQQQLAIAKALMTDPTLLIIDELSLGLSPTIVSELFDVVRKVHDDGVTCLLVEQSLSIAAELCNRAVFLEKGSVRFEGAPAELLERGDLARAVFLGDGGTPKTKTSRRRRK